MMNLVAMLDCPASSKNFMERGRIALTSGVRLFKLKVSGRVPSSRVRYSEEWRRESQAVLWPFDRLRVSIMITCFGEGAHFVVDFQEPSG
jgi:hypothetical protein